MSKNDVKNQLLSLSLDDVNKLSLQLAEQISEQPDVVVFIARGGFQIGQTFAERWNIPLIEAHAFRQGNKLKSIARPVLQILPTRLKLWLRTKELNTGYHAQSAQRSVEIAKPSTVEADTVHSILLVDDSVDTGHSILSVKKVLLELFPNAEVKIASLFVFEESKKRVHVDYCLYENRVFSAPWSNDSKEYGKFVKAYHQAKNSGVF